MIKKIFFSIFIITLCAVLISTLTVFIISNNYYSNQIITEISREAEYVSAGYEVGGYDYLEQFRNSKMRITLVSEDGTVVFDNKAAPETMDNHLDREEIKQALESGFGSSSRYSDTISEKTNYYAKRLSDGTVLRVSSVQYSIWAVLLEVLRPVISIALLTLLAGAFVAITLSKKIVQPINSIDIDNPEINHTYKELRPIVRKLSEQKQRIEKQITELQIKQSEFEAIISNMSEGMILVDHKANILTCNAGAMRILDRNGKPPISALSLTTDTVFRQALLTALAGTRFEDALKSENSYYRVIASPVTEDESVRGAVIVLFDETEKERREALRREFTSNVSHELKTPLTSISGFAELIRDGIASDEQRAHFADNIYRESARMISLIGDIIKLSQLDGKEIPFDKTQIDLHEIACDVAERLESIADRKKVSISVSGEPCFVEGNANIVEDMIYNLCDNAIKYNNEGGYVKINTGKEAEKSFFSVQDNGIGIPSSEVDRVFERFYRVDKSHSKQIGGTGLGLSIVKHAAIYHGAKINLESTLGEGTKITVTF